MEKKSYKIISILLAVCMLMGMMTSVAFASNNNIATNLQWSNKKHGVASFSCMSAIEHVYDIELYKDNECVYEMSVFSDYENPQSSVSFDLSEPIQLNGNGYYKYRINMSDVVEDGYLPTTWSQYSSVYNYTQSDTFTKLENPTNVYSQNKTIYWTQNDVNIGRYNVQLYFLTADNQLHKFQGNTPSEEYYTSYMETWDGLWEFFDEEIIHKGYDPDTTKLAASVKVLPKDIEQYGESDFSDVVVINRDGSKENSTIEPVTEENTFNFTLPDMQGEKGTTVTTENIYSSVPENMQFGVYYASDHYAENITTPAKFTFSNGTVKKEYTQERTPLKCITGHADYALDIPVPADLKSGVYKLEIDLDIANEKGSENVKPYHIVINKFTVYGKPDFEFVGITEYDEHNTPMTKGKTITVTLNDDIMNKYTKYSLCLDEVWTTYDITSNTITVPLSTNKGFQDVTLGLGVNGQDLEDYYVIWKSIIYDSKHTLVFKVNGENVTEPLTLNSGDYLGDIEYPDDPNVAGYIFDGWETMPQTMPDEDIVVNAIMTKISTVKGIVKLGDTPLENAAISIAGETATTNENGEYSVVVPCGEYMLTAKKDGMSKTITVNAKDIETNVSEITLSAKSTNITFTEPTVKTVEGLDTLLENVISDEDATYLQTPGNTITVNAKAEPKAEDAEIGTALVNTYSKYTAALYIDFTLEKVKGGAETTSDAITETNSLIAFKVAIPESIKNKAEFIILREHNGAVDALTTTPNADGEYIKVENGFMTIYANKFSTYALAGKDADPVVRSGGGGGSTSYTVKFETNGGSTLKSVSAKRNVEITEPAAPTKEGYTFDGWYSDKELTTKFDFTTKISKSITLYAKWTENAVKTSTIILTIGEKSATINGETKENDVAPKIVNDRTMLPIRFIAEALGAKVDWAENTQTVTISAEGIEISLVIGENFATVNGEKVELDSPSFVENDRTYLPIRFVSEKLGAKVDWDETAQTVTITK